MSNEKNTTKETVSARRAGELFDYAASHIDGFTNEEVMENRGWTKKQFDKTVREVRRIAGGSGDMALVCGPEGDGPWIYRLVGTREEAAPWQRYRRDTLLNGFKTLRDSHSTTSRMRDPLNKFANRDWLIDRQIERLIEDMEAVEFMRAEQMEIEA